MGISSSFKLNIGQRPNTGNVILDRALAPVYNALLMLQVATTEAAAAAGQYTIGQTDTITGTVQKLVTVIALNPGRYLEVSATLGGTMSDSVAILDFYDGITKVSSITNTGLPTAKTGAGFTLTEAKEISVYLRAGNSTTTVFVYGIGIK